MHSTATEPFPMENILISRRINGKLSGALFCNNKYNQNGGYRVEVMCKGTSPIFLFLSFSYPGCASSSLECTPGCLTSICPCCLLLDLSTFRLEFDGLCTYCIWTFRQHGDPYSFLFGSPGVLTSL